MGSAILWSGLWKRVKEVIWASAQVNWAGARVSWAGVYVGQVGVYVGQAGAVWAEQVFKVFRWAEQVQHARTYFSLPTTVGE